MAVVIRDHFDALHFTECTFRGARVLGQSLQIIADGVLPLNGYPPLSSPPPYSGTLVFKGVMRSERRLIPYLSAANPTQEFGPAYDEQEVFGPMNESEAIEFAFEGIQLDPKAWVDWMIWATSFEFIIEDKSGPTSEAKGDTHQFRSG